MAVTRHGHGLAEAGARSVGHRLVSTNAEVARVRVLGETVAVAYVLDEGEDRRRRAVGLGSVVRHDQLDVLLGLPAELPVPSHELSHAEARLLTELPPGCVEQLGDQVIRRAVPPLRAELVVAAAQDWRRGLDRLSSFEPFCSRALVLRDAPEEEAELAAEASFYGTGVVVANRGWQALVTPEPFVKRFHKPAGWWFAEEIYRRLELSTGMAGDT